MCYTVDVYHTGDEITTAKRGWTCVCLPACLPVCVSVCLSICLSVCLSTYLSTYLPTYLSNIQTYLCLFVRSSVRPCISLLSFLYLLPSSIMGVRARCELISFLSQESKTSLVSFYSIQTKTSVSILLHLSSVQKIGRKNFLLNDVNVGTYIVFIVRTYDLRVSNFVSHYGPTYDKNCGNVSLWVVLFLQMQ
jgi:hypothetical protein